MNTHIARRVARCMALPVWQPGSSAECPGPGQHGQCRRGQLVVRPSGPYGHCGGAEHQGEATCRGISRRLVAPA